MLIRALITLVLLFLLFRLYQRLFRQKRCPSCEQWIRREAAVCHHCNTLQNEDAQE